MCTDWQTLAKKTLAASSRGNPVFRRRSAIATLTNSCTRSQSGTPGRGTPPPVHGLYEVEMPISARTLPVCTRHSGYFFVRISANKSSRWEAATLQSQHTPIFFQPIAEKSGGGTFAPRPPTHTPLPFAHARGPSGCATLHETAGGA